jgi:hypothetical protein
MRKQLSAVIDGSLFDRLDNVCKQMKIKKVSAVEIALMSFIRDQEKAIKRG